LISTNIIILLIVFLNRRQELASLEALLASPGARLGRLYGRRRLGKTELLHVGLEAHGGLYYTLPEQTRAGILRYLNQETARQTGRPLDYASFRDFLLDLPNHGRRLVVLDEFQRLKAADRGAESTLQEIWDQHLQRSDIVLILCGSVIGMMEQLNQRTAPLHGRFSWDLQLPPFRYAAVRLFYPKADEAERVRRFAVFGSTPHYHRLTHDAPLDLAIRRSFLEAGAPFREEPRLLLELELRKPDRYQEILEAMGEGCRTLGEIAALYGEPGSAYTPYIQRLRDDLALVESDDPLCGKKKRSRLRFTDLFFHFYYRFVYPNLPRLELGNVDEVFRDISGELPAYHGKPAFEEVARETLRVLNGREHAGVRFDFREMGSWWDGEEELDAVAVGKTTAYAGEAKFRKEPAGPGDIDVLLRRAHLFRAAARRKTVVPFLLSRSGFTPTAQRSIDSGELLGFSLDDVAAIHESTEPRRGRGPPA
jgi:hypothetical protein